MSSGSSAKGLKKNFRRGCKSFSWVDGQYTFPEFHNLILKGHEKEAGIDKNVNIVLRLCGNTYSFSRRQTVDCLNRKYSESYFFLVK